MNSAVGNKATETNLIWNMYFVHSLGFKPKDRKQLLELETVFRGLSPMAKDLLDFLRKYQAWE